MAVVGRVWSTRRWPDKKKEKKCKLGLARRPYLAYTVYTMKVAIKQYIQNQLATNPAWAVKALVKLYTYQTANEQSAGHTEEHNGVGFSGVDSTILSSFAVQINHGRTLSVKQMAIVYKRMPRYWKQVAGFISVEKMAEIEAKVLATTTVVA